MLKIHTIAAVAAFTFTALGCTSATDDGAGHLGLTISELEGGVFGLDRAYDRFVTDTDRASDRSDRAEWDHVTDRFLGECGTLTERITDLARDIRAFERDGVDFETDAIERDASDISDAARNLRRDARDVRALDGTDRAFDRVRRHLDRIDERIGSLMRRSDRARDVARDRVGDVASDRPGDRAGASEPYVCDDDPNTDDC